MLEEEASILLREDSESLSSFEPEEEVPDELLVVPSSSLSDWLLSELLVLASLADCSSFLPRLVRPAVRPCVDWVSRDLPMSRLIFASDESIELCVADTISGFDVDLDVVPSVFASDFVLPSAGEDSFFVVLIDVEEAVSVISNREWK